MTGCTVVLFPAGTVASAEVRGGAPGTREFEALRPERTVARLDAVVLSGGSAFGLAACDGVMSWCEERGIGFPTAGGPVPIVAGMVLYDLAVGDGRVRPGSDQGRAACEAATDGPLAVGLVGAGTGCTIDKWQGREHARPGAIASLSVRDGDLVVGVLVAVNAFGGPRLRAGPIAAIDDQATSFTNSTIGVVATNATLGKGECLLVAQGAHDGLARAVDPPHTGVDGDAFVAAAVGGVEATVDRVRWLALLAIEEAVASVMTAPA